MEVSKPNARMSKRILSNDITKWISSHTHCKNSDFSANQTIEEKENSIRRIITNKKEADSFVSPVRVMRKKMGKLSTFASKNIRVFSVSRNKKFENRLSPFSNRSKEDVPNTNKSQMLSSTVERRTIDMRQYLTLKKRKANANNLDELSKSFQQQVDLPKKIRIFSQECLEKMPVAQNFADKFKKNQDDSDSSMNSCPNTIKRNLKSKFLIPSKIKSKTDKFMNRHLKGQKISANMKSIQLKLNQQRQMPKRRLKIKKNLKNIMPNLTFLSELGTPKYLSPEPSGHKSYFRGIVSP
ncbi:unnamed protein product [Moneuplotes crassus]|uniref:Uncharacterized protein n=1 Tax=Euplotes crassus TaxID=5936 RepID=A0AAD1UNJ0_EUPCR|nr:unnamed protein product [Moneuplotes crassus]